jgi:hypothetical protein
MDDVRGWSRRLDPLAARTMLLILQAQFVMCCESGWKDAQDEIVFMEMCHMYSLHLDARNRPPVSFSLPAVDEPWNAFDPHVFREHTRFLPGHFLFVVAAMKDHIPVDDDGNIVGRNRCVCDHKLAVYIALRRWSIPDRWTDIEIVLRRRKAWMLDIYMEILEIMSSAFKKLVTRIDVLRTYPLLGAYAASVTNAGGLLPNVVCFVDGKAFATCKPAGLYESQEGAGVVQEMYYNGYYRCHGLKMQCVMWPDGMRHIHIESVKDHDSLLYVKSGFEVQLSSCYIDGDANRPAQAYGDPAYREAEHMSRKHKGAGRTKEQRRIDSSMQIPRGSAEDAFQKQSALWSMMDYKKKNKLLQNPLVDQMIAQTFFCNVHTCIYGSMVNATFGLEAPSLADYLHSNDMGYLV